MIKLSTTLFLKNEGQTIYRCLDSCSAFTDEYVIGIDNSCTDNTEFEVNRFIKENPTLDIITYKFDWNESFAFHRNEGMDKASGDWILVMDGHEYFPESWMNITEKKLVNSQMVMGMIKSHLVPEGVIEDDVLKESDEIFLNLYQQPFMGQTPANFFMQPRIYRNGKSKNEKYLGEKIRFGRAAHNCIKYTRPELGVQYPEAIIIHDAPEENRAERSVQRQKMNVKQLKNDLKINSKDTRALFYLGNTYLEGKRIEDAIKCFDKYLLYTKVETEETYQCYLHLALAYKELENYNEALKMLFQCVRINSMKRDGFLLIGDMLMLLDRTEEAIHNYNTALAIKAPVSRMFSNGGTYTWLPHQQLVQAYKKLENAEMAISHLKICLSYEKHQGWQEELKELLNDKKNVLIVDHIGSFTNDFKEYMENKTYNVIKVAEWSNTLAIWADAIFVEWGDVNACQIGKFKKKTVIRIHGYEAYLNRHLFGNIPWDCKQIIYVADHIKEMIGQDGTVIPNGVDTDKFWIKEPVRDSSNVGYVGYLNGKKNPMRLAEIIKKNPSMKFNLRVDFQDPFLEESFKYETKKCKNIIYHGRYDDINDFYNQMSYMISTSDVESFSYQIAEGMSAGCTPVVYNWRGAKDIWRKDFIFNDMPVFELQDMNEMREYIRENYPLSKQMLSMETMLIGD